MNKKIIYLKIVLISILLIVLGVCIIIFTNSKESIESKLNETSGLSYEEQIFDDNSYYSDKSFHLEDLYRKKYLVDFIYLIISDSYEEAFNYLTDLNKEYVFDNNIEKFKQYIYSKKNILEYIIHNDDFDYISETYEDDLGIIEYEYVFDTNELSFEIEDNGPFDIKLNMKK